MPLEAGLCAGTRWPRGSRACGTEAVRMALANREAQLGQVLERMAQTATELTGMIEEQMVRSITLWR